MVTASKAKKNLAGGGMAKMALKSAKIMT